jgi:hypothetical protein
VWVEMSKLISGKEALIALANGEDVEVSHPHDKWHENWESLSGSGGKFFLLYLLDESIGYKFRLKPKTITINGIEVPAPFEPKEGDMVWCLNELSEKGYEARTTYDSNNFTANIAYWRTEDEIKQVVAELKKIFVINNQ